MDKDKEQLLNDTLTKAINIGFGLASDENLEEVFAKKIMVIGTAVEEQYSSLDGLRQLIRMQKEQSQGMELSFKRTEVYRDFPAAENMAIVVDDIWLRISVNNEITGFGMRASAILEFKHAQWKMVHWHVSKPEQVASEKDTYGIEEWKQKADALERLVAERTADLVEKNRELAIEAVLEKVRSRSMGMQKSDELSDVIKVVFEQFKKVNIFTEHAGFIIDYKTRSDMFIWLADEHAVPAQLTIPYFNSPHWNSFIEAKEKGKDFFANQLGFEEKNKFYQDLFSLFPAVTKETTEYYLNCPGLAISTVLLDDVGLYIENFSGIPYSDEENKILMRFGKVFQQTYTRFLDLQKAEQQAREAQVGLCLERVRARTMSMHHSNELAATSAILFQQIKKLGFETWSCGFCIWTEHDAVELWMGADSGALLAPMIIPYKDERTHLDIYTARQQNKSSHHKTWEGKDLQEHYTFLQTIPSVKTALEQLEKAGQSLPHKQCYYVGFFKQGYLLLITKEPNEALEELSKRFASVFDLTYTRFLDLKKAEAQSRESDIELALERVRARTMAMQHSNELGETSLLLDSQIRRLGIKTRGCAFNIYGDNASTEWFSSENGSMPTYKTPRNNIFAHYYEEGKTGRPMYIQTFEGEECSAHYDYLMTIPVLGDSLKALKASGGSFPVKQIDHVTYFKYGYLLFITLEPAGEAHDIFIRFAKVFEQTYTRFLDLQSAEAQTRDAQINLAVERVRAGALAMFKSEEIIGVVAKLKDEVMALNIPDVIAATIFLSEGDDNVRMWDLSSLEKDNNGYLLPFDITFKLKEKDPFLYVKRVWENPDSYFIEVQDEKDFKRYVAWLKDNNKIEVANEIEEYIAATQLKRLHHVVKKLNNGKLAIDLLSFPPDEMEPILTKMGAAFDLAYTRFLDLQKAEGLAVKAEKDLLVIIEAKKEAEDALLELKQTQSQLIHSEKMASLGELTAGIAHEIQNPLNFVNNFSEVCRELIEELKNQRSTLPGQEQDELLNDIDNNLEKISLHGKRADGIVKGMLQHSRKSGGTKEPTGVNALCDEYLKLAYHGLRAKEKLFNATLNTDFDTSIGSIAIIPQDIGRVLLNLYNNAFYAVVEKGKLDFINRSSPYKPTISVSTKKAGNRVEITISDNGNGIPQQLLAKIFQPFFTTKPTGQGTGLGLSLSYDIVKAHGGDIKVETTNNEGSSFLIRLPIS